MSHPHSHSGAPTTEGVVIRWAGFYDFLVKIFWLGREPKVHAKIIAAATLEPGERVLDVGCGPGSLAIEVAKRLGSGSEVVGIDPSVEMIERARTKAADAGASATFRVGVVEALEFPDAHFDAVFSTLVFHHLPDDDLQRKAFDEILRVLKPGGRLVLADFGGKTQIARLVRECRAAGFSEPAIQNVGRRFHFVLVAEKQKSN